MIYDIYTLLLGCCESHDEFFCVKMSHDFPDNPRDSTFQYLSVIRSVNLLDLFNMCKHINLSTTIFPHIFFIIQFILGHFRDFGFVVDIDNIEYFDPKLWMDRLCSSCLFFFLPKKYSIKIGAKLHVPCIIILF